MKQLVILFVLFLWNHVMAQSAISHSVGLSSSYRGFNVVEDELSFNGEYQLDWKKFTLNGNLGFERWYVKRGNNVEYSYDMKPTYTSKFELFIGYKQPLLKSPVFLSSSIGVRFYTFGSLKDSIYLTSENALDDSELSLSMNSRAYRLAHENEIPPGYYLPRKAAIYSINSMPCAFMAKAEIGYTLEHFNVRLFVLPYWVVMKYENRYDSNLAGKKFFFFYDIGIGVNYTLPHKKEKENT